MICCITAQLVLERPLGGLGQGDLGEGLPELGGSEVRAVTGTVWHRGSPPPEGGAGWSGRALEPGQ